MKGNVALVFEYCRVKWYPSCVDDPIKSDSVSALRPSLTFIRLEASINIKSLTMADLFALVDEKIRTMTSDNETLQLWKEILEWYGAGGSPHVELNFERKVRQIKSEFLKGIREIEPEVKAPKKRLRKRRS